MPCLDGQMHTGDQDHRAFVQLMRRSVVERPINWVRPRIHVPDSTTPANPREELAIVMVNEAADVDIETVTVTNQKTVGRNNRLARLLENYQNY